MGSLDTAAVPTSALCSTRWSLAVFALLLGFSLLTFSPLVADPDLWGHVRFGQDLWATNHIIRPDVYSYLTGEQPWINHEWLAEAIYAGLYAALETPGLIALNVAVGLLIVGLIYWHLLRRGIGSGGAGGITAFFGRRSSRICSSCRSCSSSTRLSMAPRVGSGRFRPSSPCGPTCTVASWQEQASS
jgi:hypothetical protein